MRHYCNRQKPKTEPKTEVTYIKTTELQTKQPQKQEEHKKDKNDELMLPPGSNHKIPYTDADYLYSADEKLTGEGGSVTQCCGFAKQLSGNNIYDCSLCRQAPLELTSVSPPLIAEPLTMEAYLKRYMGKSVCVDLWSLEGGGTEKCGTITDVGRNFFVIRNDYTGELFMIDLKSVRWVNIHNR